MQFWEISGTVLTLSLQILGIVFNVIVARSCDFLRTSYGARYGLHKYRPSTNTALEVLYGSGFVSEECHDTYSLYDYDGFEGNFFRGAQVCSRLSTAAGFFLVGMTIYNQLCWPRLIVDRLISFTYTVANFGAAMVWLVLQICDAPFVNGCMLGDAAKFQFAAQGCFLLSSFVHSCLPGPPDTTVLKGSTERRAADKAETRPAGASVHAEEDEEEVGSRSHEGIQIDETLAVDGTSEE